MSTTKLTLSVDPEVIAKARRISKRKKTNISAMFSQYIAAMEENTHKRSVLPPMTKRAVELAPRASQLPEDWNYREELADILDEKHGVK